MQLHTSSGESVQGGSFIERLRVAHSACGTAIKVTIREGGSVSFAAAWALVAGRAARLVDFMAEDGIVGNYNGSQVRK